MNTLIRPIFNLMNQLSYRKKFVLIASLFAVPLAFFAGQLAYSLHSISNQATRTIAGLNYFQHATALIEELESIRDLSVISALQSESVFPERFEESKKRAINRIANLLKRPESAKHVDFLDNLLSTITQHQFVRPSESVGFDSIFDDANALVESVHAWRTKLFYTVISSTRSDEKLISTTNILNDSNIYLNALGRMRTYGTVILLQKFVQSHTVDLLEENYQQLEKLIQSIEAQAEEYKALTNDHPQLNRLQLGQHLSDAQSMLYERLIMVLSPDSDPVQYYEDATEIIQSVYRDNQTLFSLADQLLQQNKKESHKRLAIFYISAGLMTLLTVYVYIGLYAAMNLSIQKLMYSARQVATGKYEKPIRIAAKDELASVANAMDSMRLSIREREDKLASMVHTDGLTKLYNRQYFDDALERALANSRRQGTPFTLVMIDIDHFKSINDTFGHQAGDKCLVHVSQLLQRQFQRKTDVVARYGGEEFMVILYGSNLVEAEIQTELLRKLIADSPVTHDEKTINLTASFGLVALTPPDVVSSKELISLADDLLYQSKHNGRNRLSSAHYRASNTEQTK